MSLLSVLDEDEGQHCDGGMESEAVVAVVGVLNVCLYCCELDVEDSCLGIFRGSCQWAAFWSTCRCGEMKATSIVVSFHVRVKYLLTHPSSPPLILVWGTASLGIEDRQLTRESHHYLCRATPNSYQPLQHQMHPSPPWVKERRQVVVSWWGNDDPYQKPSTLQSSKTSTGATCVIISRVPYLHCCAC